VECRHRNKPEPASISSSLVSKLTVVATGKSFWYENFCQIFISCQSFTRFNIKTVRPPIGLARQLICWQGRLQTSFLSRFAAKQPGLKSDGLQSVVSKCRRSTKGGSRTLTNCVCVSWQLGTNWISTIDTAVRQWRTRLRACVTAKGGHRHSEHKLSQ